MKNLNFKTNHCKSREETIEILHDPDMTRQILESEKNIAKREIKKLNNK